MDIQLLHPHHLTENQFTCWKQMMNSMPGMDSPFFHPDYICAVAKYRKQVRVAVITEQNIPTGFFPFEKHGISGQPVGIKLSDFQGVVRDSIVEIDAQTLLEGCGLKNWHFDHLVDSQKEFAPWVIRSEESCFMDLSSGFNNYLECRKQAGSSHVANVQRKQRKIERELGTLRFEWHTDQQSVFDNILQWKSAQRMRTRSFDILQFEWVRQLLKEIKQTQTAGFEGVVSTLFANDQLIAAHLGMKTKTVFHHWFPVYNLNFQKYSPGQILLLKTAQAAAENGVQRLDFGKGNERYKSSLGSGALSVAEGTVELRHLHHTVRNLWYRTREWVRNSPLHAPAQYPKKFIRSINTKNSMS